MQHRNYSVAYEETQSNRVSYFRDFVCCLFPKAVLFYFYFSYTLEGTVLENVDYIKYLGVTITRDLRRNIRVSNMRTRANRTLGFLRQNLYQCPQDVKETAFYRGLVRPVLE